MLPLLKQDTYIALVEDWIEIIILTRENEYTKLWVIVREPFKLRNSFLKQASQKELIKCTNELTWKAFSKSEWSSFT